MIDFPDLQVVLRKVMTGQFTTAQAEKVYWHVRLLDRRSVR